MLVGISEAGSRPCVWILVVIGHVFVRATVFHAGQSVRVKSNKVDWKVMKELTLERIVVQPTPLAQEVQFQVYDSALFCAFATHGQFE